MHQLLQIFLKTSTQSSTGSLVEKSGLPLLELEQQVVPDWKEGGGVGTRNDTSHWNQFCRGYEDDIAGLLFHFGQE